jgi:hypothetical protein
LFCLSVFLALPVPAHISQDLAGTGTIMHSPLVIARNDNGGSAHVLAVKPASPIDGQQPVIPKV